MSTLLQKDFTLLIDRLSLTLPIEPGKQELVVKRFSAQQGFLTPDPSYRVRKGTLRQRSFYTHAGTVDLVEPYGTQTSGAAAGKKSALLLQFGPAAVNAPFGRLELNPNALGLADTMRAFQVITDVLGSASTCLGAATVTRLDVAIDLPNVTVDQYLWERSVAVKRSIISGGGRVQTVYVGITRGDNICIYDRTAKAGSSFPITRVERRLHPSIAFAALAHIDNPFADISAHDVGAALAQVPSAWHGIFRTAAVALGYRGAVNQLPEGMRQAARAKIKEARFAAWQPDAIWLGWPSCLNATFGSQCLLDWSLPKPPSPFEPGYVAA